MIDAALRTQFEQVVQLLDRNETLIDVTQLHGGISAETHRLQLLNRQVVIRRYRHHSPSVAKNEFTLLQQLYALGLAVPKPLYLDQSGSIFPVPYIIINHVDGRMQLAPSDVESYLTQYAAQLAAIHRVDAAGHDLSYLPVAAPHCVESGPALSVLDGVAQVRAVMGEFRPKSANPTTLLHGDPWPGNLLWRADQLLAIIDWEDAQVGDPLRDLAIARMETAALFGIEAMALLTEQYVAQQPLNIADLAYWDLCASLRFARLVGSDLAEFVAFFPPYQRADITERFIQANYHAFVEQALQQIT